MAEHEQRHPEHRNESFGEKVPPAPEPGGQGEAGKNERIQIADVQELRRWTKTLGVSSDMLVSAVRAVGHDSNKVIEFLRRPKAS
jgi:hypothetical protein